MQRPAPEPAPFARSRGIEGYGKRSEVDHLMLPAPSPFA